MTGLAVVSHVVALSWSGWKIFIFLVVLPGKQFFILTQYSKCSGSCVSTTPGGGTGMQMPPVTGVSRVLKLSPKKLWNSFWHAVEMVVPSKSHWNRLQEMVGEFSCPLCIREKANLQWEGILHIVGRNTLSRISICSFVSVCVRNWKFLFVCFNSYYCHGFCFEKVSRDIFATCPLIIPIISQR